jgi:hypothetical protein
MATLAPMSVNKLTSNLNNPFNNDLNQQFSYIITKNNKNHRELESNISFLIIISIVILVVLLFFISYKIFVFMTVNNVDIGIFPYNNNPNSDGYDLNYLAEQAYYKSLSDTDKDSYLSLQDFEKDTAIKKYLVSQIVL